MIPLLLVACGSQAKSAGTVKRSLASKLRSFAALAALLSLTAQAAGCVCDGQRQDAKFVKCGHLGSVDVSSPTFSLPPAAVVTSGGSCLLADDTCFGQASVLFDSSGSGSNGIANALVLGFTVPSIVGAGTHTLVGGATDVALIATLHQTNADGLVITTDLVVQAGALDIHENTGAQFSGTFAMEVDSADGLHHLSLTDGFFNVSPCAIETAQACIGI